MKLAPLLLFLLLVLLANFGASIEAFECFGISSSNSSVCSGRGVCAVGNVCECYEGYSGPRCSRTDGIVQSSILFGKFGSSGNFNYGLLSDPSGLSKSSLSSDLLVADANFLIRFNMDGKVVSKSASSGAAKFVELSDGSFLFFPSSGLYTYLMRSGKKLTTYIDKQSNTLCYIYTLLYNSNDGFLYGTDLLNNIIFKIDAKNIDSSTELTCVPVAGIYGHVGFTEDKSRFANASLLFSPTGLILNQNNELVFSDMRNNRIRKITTDGYIVTLASNLNGPTTLAFSPSGDLYFLEIGTKTIKRLDRRGVVSSLGELDSMNYKSSFIFADAKTIIYTDNSNIVVRRLILDSICDIEPLMTGEDCLKPQVFCDSIGYNSPHVCSSHGSCVSNNTCVCEYGYYGSNCSTFSCFSIPADSADVCSGNGQCVEKNTCNCKPDYYGKDCNTYSCFGKTSDDSSICSGKGVCSGTDVCSCYDGYYGAQCQSKYASISYITRAAVPENGPQFSNLCFDGTYPLMTASGDLYRFNTPNVSLIGNFGFTQTISNMICTDKFIFYTFNMFSIMKKDRVTNIDSLLLDLSTGIKLTNNNGASYTIFKPVMDSFSYSSEYGFFLSINSLIIRYLPEEGRFELVAGIVPDFSNTAEMKSVPTPRGVQSAIFSYNGLGNNIQLSYPSSFLIHKGILYFVEFSLQLIRKVDLTSRYVSIVAGVPNSYTNSYTANLQNATSSPIFVSKDSILFFKENELYFGDSSNYLIRKVSDGIIIDVAGIPKVSQDSYLINVDSLKSAFKTQPSKIAADPTGNIFVLDGYGSIYKYLEKKYDCEDGFTGPTCNTPQDIYCNSLSFMDPQVCSGHGKCSKLGCSCDFGFSGKNCNETSCFGKMANDSSVCNGKGLCVSFDNCVCGSAYFGTECSEFRCNNLLYNDSNVCSGKGLCNAPNNCTCYQNNIDGFWEGLNCASCRYPYQGSNCLEITQTPTCVSEITCTGNGICNQKGICECRGNFEGVNCNQCKTGYFGSSCNLYCDLKTCKNGVCDKLGGCSCNSNNTTGFWSGANCDKCQNGYYGEKCQVRIIGPAVISSYGNSISFKLFAPSSYTRVGVDIWRLIKDMYSEGSLAWANLGINPVAYWTNREQGEFVIELGDNFDIKPDMSQIEIRSDLFDTNMNANATTVTMLLTPPLNPVKPIALIKGKQEYGSCEDLVMDGSFSYSGDKQPLRYFWSVINTTELEFSKIVANQTESKFTIPFNKFPPGWYTIELVVESSMFGIKSNVFSLSIHKSNFPLPVISIFGRTSITTNRLNVPLVIKKSVVAPSCLNDTQILTSWSQISGPTINFIVDSNGNLVITNFPTYRVQSYQFEAAAALSTSPNNKAFASVTVNTFVQPLELTSSIAYLNFDSVTVNIAYKDPEATSEQEKWMFSCETNNCGPNIDNYFSLASMQKLTSFKIERMYLDQTAISTGSMFNIKLTIQKGAREVSKSITFRIPKLPSSIPPVISQCLKSDTNINPTDWVYVNCIVTVNGTLPDQELKYDWFLDGVSFNSLKNPWKGAWLYMSAIEFEEGRTYTLTLVVTYRGESSSYDYVFTINRTPRCSCFVTPLSVYALDQQVTMTCPNCQVPDLSYEISFGYYDFLTNSEVTLYSAVDNSFSTALPTKSEYSDCTNVFIKIVDKNTGATITKQFCVITLYPNAGSLSDVLVHVEQWSLIVANLQNGDPAKYIFNSVSIANAIKLLLSNIGSSGNTRKLRGLECNGNGDLINGVCNCHVNYTTSSCKYTKHDFELIQKMKERLFKDFVNSQNSRNSSIELISEDIMKSSLQGLQSFLSDFDFLTSDMFSICMELLEKLLKEAIERTEFSISDTLASSYISVMDNITKFKGTFYNQKINSFIEHLTALVQREKKPGQTTLRFTSLIGVYIIGKGYKSDLALQNIKYSDNNATVPLYVILPSSIEALANTALETSFTHTLKISNVNDPILEQVKGIRKSYNNSVISPFMVQWKMDNYEISELKSRIIFQIPLVKSINSQKRSSSYYYCHYLDDNGNVKADDTCNISFLSLNLAQCECSKQTTVFVVESILNQNNQSTNVVPYNSTNKVEEKPKKSNTNYGLLTLLTLLGIPILCGIAAIMGVVHYIKTKKASEMGDN